MTPLWALPLVVAMQTRAASAPPRPVAWAAQSPRPAVCAGSHGLWEMSRQAVVERRCRELARAQTLLLSAPEQALSRASALLEQAPDWSAARVLHGRASLRVGDAKTALVDLLPLVAEASEPTADVAALQDGGRAALAQGDLASAARFYRKLGSGAALLPRRTDQAVAYVEIAAALLAGESAPVDEVLAYLREARRRAPGSGLSGLCSALSAVAWVAAGHEAEGQGALSEVGDVWALRRFEAPGLVWLPGGVFQAVMGLALERHSAELSADYYRELSESPLSASALGKLAARRKDGGKRGGK